MVTILSALAAGIVSVLDKEERKMLFLVGKDLKRVVIVISPRITLFGGIYGDYGNGNPILLKYYCSAINENGPKRRVSLLNYTRGFVLCVSGM